MSDKFNIKFNERLDSFWIFVPGYGSDEFLQRLCKWLECRNGELKELLMDRKQNDYHLATAGAIFLTICL